MCALGIVKCIIFSPCFPHDEDIFVCIISDDLIFGVGVDGDEGALFFVGLIEDLADLFKSMSIGIGFEDRDDGVVGFEGLEVGEVVEEVS